MFKLALLVLLVVTMMMVIPIEYMRLIWAVLGGWKIGEFCIAFAKHRGWVS